MCLHFTQEGSIPYSLLASVCHAESHIHLEAQTTHEHGRLPRLSRFTDASPHKCGVHALPVACAFCAAFILHSVGCQLGPIHFGPVLHRIPSQKKIMWVSGAMTVKAVVQMMGQVFVCGTVYFWDDNHM